MSILKSSIQPNGLKEISLGNSIGAFEKLLRDEYQRGNVGFELDTHFLIVISLGTFMDTYPTAQYDDDENFFYIPNSTYENIAFFFENPYSFAQDNKLEEITINDLSLLVICSL